MVNKFNTLDSNTQEWFKNIILRIVEDCEGGYNSSISNIDRGGRTIYGIASNTSSRHRDLFEWLMSQYQHGKRITDSVILDRLASFYYNEYVSTHPLLTEAVNSNIYPITWLLLNTNINGFCNKEITTLVDDIVISVQEELENASRDSDQNIESVIDSRKILLNKLVVKIFNKLVLYLLLSKLTINYLRQRAYNIHPKFERGLVSRFYKNISPLIYDVFGPEGVKLIPSTYLDPKTFIKIGNINGK